MFGLSTATLVLYGGIFAAGAGGVWYVMDLRAENQELMMRNEAQAESIRITKRSMLAAADTAARTLKESDARLAQAERENRQADGQIARLTDLINDPKPSTCDAAVLAVQRAMP